MVGFLIFIAPFIVVFAAIGGLFVWGSKHRFTE